MLPPRLDLFVHSFSQPGRVCYQHRFREHVVLCLGKKIGGAKCRIGGVVSDHHGLRGAVKTIYTDLAVNLFLGQRDKNVPRAADGVYARHGLGAVGHGRNCLSAAYAEYTVNTGNISSNQHRRAGHLVALGRRAYDDLFYARNPGRYGRHEHRRWIEGSAARNVSACAADCVHHLAVAFVEVSPALEKACLMVFLDSSGCQLFGNLIVAFCDCRCGHLYLLDSGAIKLGSQIPDCCIPFVPDALEDVLHNLCRSHGTSEHLQNAFLHVLGHVIEIEAPALY